MNSKIVLIGCCGKKRTTPCAAKDLYLSPLFKKSVAWAERFGLSWAVLSAKHGLVWPKDVVVPYNLSMRGMSSADKLGWKHLVMRQLQPYRQYYSFIVLAGKEYCTWTSGYQAELPMNGMGIGTRLKVLSEKNGENDMVWLSKEWRKRSAQETYREPSSGYCHGCRYFKKTSPLSGECSLMGGMVSKFGECKEWRCA